MGPWYCYNMLKNSSKYIEALKTLTFQPGDEVMFCQGEVDSRIQLVKRAAMTNLDDAVKTVVDRYMLGCEAIRKEFPGVSFGCYGPVASAPDGVKTNNWFDTNGTTVERNKGTMALNVKIEEECKKHGFWFVTLFYDLVDQNLMSKKELWHDQIHISIQKTYDLLEKAWLKYRGKPLVP